MSFFIQAEEDGAYYSLTSAGIAAIIILSVLLLIVIAVISAKHTENEKKRKLFNSRKLAFTAIAIALAFVLSYVKIVHLPWGGAATLCSMLFIVLVGNWYGPGVGIIAGFIYGCLQFIQGGGSYILSPAQVCLDYLLAFAVLGFSGFFYKMKKNGLLVGYIVAILARGAAHSLGGYMFWMDYMPENFPASLAAIYPIVYNYSYILVEAVITIIIILLPPTKKALAHIKEMATQA